MKMIKIVITNDATWFKKEKRIIKSLYGHGLNFALHEATNDNPCKYSISEIESGASVSHGNTYKETIAMFNKKLERYGKVGFDKAILKAKELFEENSK